MKRFSRFRLFASIVLLAVVSSSAFAADSVTVTGTVTNETTGQPSAGDAVALVAPALQMKEVAHTLTDPKGHYSLSADQSGMYVVRVEHQGTSYFQLAPPGTKLVDVKVFNVAPAVKGVTTEANVIRLETSGGVLNVIQSFFVKNASSPPTTQGGSHAYELFLPVGAQIEESAAMGPDGMPVKSPLVPIGKDGRYAYGFPVRPGETQFQVTYHLPYSGSLALTPRLAMPAGDFLVMVPDSMKFQAQPGASFEAVNQPAGAVTYVVRKANVHDKLGFTVSGSGSLPQAIQGAGQSAQAGNPTAGDVNDRPGIGLGKPIDTPYPLSKYKWWILGSLVLMFAIAAGLLLRRPVPAVAAGPSTHVPVLPVARAGEPTLADRLNDEMFAIETDHATGKLSEAEYAELKQALDLLLRRAEAENRQPA